MPMIQYIGPHASIALGGQHTFYKGVPRWLEAGYAQNLPEREYREWEPGDDAETGPPILLHVPRDPYLAVFMVNAIKRLIECWPTYRVDILTDKSLIPLFPGHRAMASISVS